MLQRIAITLRGRGRKNFAPYLRATSSAWRCPASRPGASPRRGPCSPPGWRGWRSGRHSPRARVEGLDDIEPAQFEAGLAHQSCEVGLAPGQKVIHRKDRVAFRQQRLAEIRSQEAGASGHQRAHRLLLLLSRGGFLGRLWLGGRRRRFLGSGFRGSLGGRRRWRSVLLDSLLCRRSTPRRPVPRICPSCRAWHRRERGRSFGAFGSASRLGGGGGGAGGGGANGFRNFRISVRERSLPSSSR